MNKSKLVLAFIIVSAAAGAAMANRARSFIGYIGSGGIYSTVYVPFECPEIGWGCIYTSGSNTYQVYTRQGILLNPVKP